MLRGINHPFPDELPAPGQVRCYSFEEVFAEKIRAMGERSRPRDLYDIVNLYRRTDLRKEAGLIREVLHEKCASKGVPVPTLSAIEQSPHREALVSEWSNMLAHQLQALPPFETYWGELADLFDWLEGGQETGDLLLVSTIPFKPVFKIELGGGNPREIPQLSHFGTKAPFAPRMPAARRSFGRTTHGPVYVIKCGSCGKEFRRNSMNTALKPHKGKGGWPCHCAAGYFVRMG